MTCPACHGTEFREGPHGGLSINWECVKCGNRWNETLPTRPLEWIGHRSDDWLLGFKRFVVEQRQREAEATVRLEGEVAP